MKIGFFSSVTNIPNMTIRMKFKNYLQHQCLLNLTKDKVKCLPRILASLVLILFTIKE